MIKKTLILASLLAFTVTTAIADTNTPCPLKAKEGKPPVEGKFQPPPPNHKKMEEKRAEFEKKLKLTDEQKAQAKEIRMKGHEEMKPIMEQMKAKKVEFDTVKNDNELTVGEQKAKLAQIRAEMKTLRKQARDLRIKNMQEFESILTDKQKQTLEKMKQEGRKNFKKTHPKRQHCAQKCKCTK